MNKTKSKVLAQVAKHSGVTSVGLVAGDLGLSIRTVRKYVDELIADGRLGIGHDGCALELSDAERHERATDARVATHR